MSYSEFWSCGGGSSDSVLWIPIYGRTKRWWHEISIMPLYRLGRMSSAAKWWMLHHFHPQHRYHIVNTGLKPGYYDEDTLILHACFAMLERYVKWHEGPDALEKFSAKLRGSPDPNAPNGVQNYQAARQDEAVALYRWWKIEKPADEKRRDELLMLLYGNRKFETKPTENPMLHEWVPPAFGDDETRLNGEFRALEKKIEDDEQKMLHRLIGIRRSLWT